MGCKQIRQTGLMVLSRPVLLRFRFLRLFPAVRTKVQMIADIKAVILYLNFRNLRTFREHTIQQFLQEWPVFHMQAVLFLQLYKTQTPFSVPCLTGSILNNIVHHTGQLRRQCRKRTILQSRRFRHIGGVTSIVDSL